MDQSDVEYAETIEALAKLLREAQRVCKQDLRNILVGMSEPDINRAIWEACESVRKESHGAIDFGPLARSPGYLERRTPQQIARYSLRQRAAGLRKQERSLERMRSAAGLVTETKEKAALDRRAEREAERQNYRKARERPAMALRGRRRRRDGQF